MSEQTEEKLNIAFASSNLTHLDEHFGSCSQLTIYSLSTQSREHLKTVEFIPSKGHNQQKINDRLAVLEDCFAVYCLACGNPVRKQLLAQGTRVVVHSETELIDNLLAQIQANWPGKVALRQQRQTSRKKDTDYFNALAASEWDEEL